VIFLVRKLREKGKNLELIGRGNEISNDLTIDYDNEYIFILLSRSTPQSSKYRSAEIGGMTEIW
jgi:hypothetical protein